MPIHYIFRDGFNKPDVTSDTRFFRYLPIHTVQTIQRKQRVIELLKAISKNTNQPGLEDERDFSEIVKKTKKYW